MSEAKQQAAGKPAAGVTRWLDAPCVLAEVLMRNVYWRWAALRGWRRRQERARPVAIQECSREGLRGYLESIGVTTGALVMLHTRVTGLRIIDNGPWFSTWQVSEMLLGLIEDLLGPSGTLAMATNAKYQTDVLQANGHYGEMLTYDPERTPCYVGLANELFWRQKGTKRSLFPYNMLAARGPLAEALLRDNLNERRPSPHGVDSGYYRFCQRNGLVVSIGVPLRDCLTLARVVEEVRSDWPIKDFFSEHRYRVVQDGTAKEWAVRLTRDNYDKFCHCGKKMGRDLKTEGVIHEGNVGTVRVDWARAGEIYEFFRRKSANQPYPYYCLWLARKSWGRQS